MKWWPFNKKRQIGRLAVSLERWNIGDIGECLTGESWLFFATGKVSSGPKPGTQVIVTAVRIFRNAQVLRLVGWPGYWCAADFRKIVCAGAEEPRITKRSIKEPV